MTRSSTPCSSIWEAGTVCSDAAVADDQDGVGEAEDFFDLAGDDDDGVAGGGEAADEGVDLGAGADIDTAGRLIEQQHSRAVHEPAGEEDLLLVSSGEGHRGPVGVGGTQFQRLDLLAGDLALGAFVEEPALGESRHRRQGHVHEDRLVEHQALALALLGREADAGVDGVDDRAAAQRLAGDLDGAGGGAARAVDGFEDLGPSGADQPGEPDHLAGADRERHVLEDAGESEALDLEDGGRIGGDRDRRREHVLDRSTGHQPDELHSGGVGDGEPARHRPAVLQHGDAVADLADLLQTMGDVDHGDAGGGELPDDMEEVLHLFAVEHRRRLVHDDQLDVVRQRPRHAHDLLVRRAELADLGVGRQIRVTEPAKQLAGLASSLGALGESAARELVAEEDVLGDRQAVDDVELLVHGRDAEFDGRLGRGDLDRLAEPGDLALIGAMDAGEHLDQGRLARAVLAEDAVHLAGKHIQVDSAQRVHAGERLRHAFDVE